MGLRQDMGQIDPQILQQLQQGMGEQMPEDEAMLQQLLQQMGPQMEQQMEPQMEQAQQAGTDAPASIKSKTVPSEIRCTSGIVEAMRQLLEMPSKGGKNSFKDVKAISAALKSAKKATELPKAPQRRKLAEGESYTEQENKEYNELRGDVYINFDSPPDSLRGAFMILYTSCDLQGGL